MTEDEAKKSWCFHAHDLRNSPGTSCLGSGCMAWRWRQVPNPAWKDDTFGQMSMGGRPNPYSTVSAGIDSATEGFCGLAGRP